MRNNRTRQAYLSIIEVLQVSLAIIAIGASGVLVYQHYRHKPASAAGGAPATQQYREGMKSEQTTPQYLTIKEWGVRVPYSGNLKLSYTMSSDDRTAVFSSDQLTALSSSCLGKGGSVVRWASTDQVSEGPAEANAPTAEQVFANADPSTYAHIGNYYYRFAHAQSGCGEITITAALQSQTNDAVSALVPSFQAIPN